MTDRVIDYRETMDPPPDACPECGGEISTHEEHGRVHIYGPADREWAREYGIEGDGLVETIWTRWHCASDPAHAGGPILMASAPQVIA